MLNSVLWTTARAEYERFLLQAAKIKAQEAVQKWGKGWRDQKVVLVDKPDEGAESGDRLLSRTVELSIIEAGTLVAGSTDILRNGFRKGI